MSRSVIVLPDDTGKPIVDAINAATKSLRIKMFLFSDPGLIQAVVDAHRRKVQVRIMLNPARRNGEQENEETRRILTEAGVEVLDSNPKFDLTHEKSMVIDDTTAFVKSLNWETKNLTETRDYAVVTPINTKSTKSSSVLKLIGTGPTSPPETTPIWSGVSATAANESANSSTTPNIPSFSRMSAIRTRS